MDKQRFEFLKRLLDAAGPSGYEARPARVWREEAERFADAVDADVNGNSFATVNEGGEPRVMLAGHADEIGLMVTHIAEEGYLRLDGIGGWDPQVLVGQRIRVLASGGSSTDVPGVIGKKPIHLMKSEDREKASKLEDLWIDIGAEDRDAVREQGIRVGDAAVIDAGLVELAGGMVASRAMDDRVGAFVVLEALRLLAEDPPTARTTAVATTQEEIGFPGGGGAGPSAYQLEPQVAIVVDVTHATDAPGIEKTQIGEHEVGGGPVLTRGSSCHPVVFERLVEAAEGEGIEYSIQGSPRRTSTDADAVYFSRSGVPTGVVSVPNRYMHSPSEIVSLDDLEGAAGVIAAFVRGLDANVDFVPKP